MSYLAVSTDAGYIGKKHLERAMRHVLMEEPSGPVQKRIDAFSVIRVPFFLEPNYDEDKPYIESNRERLIQKWGGVEGWELQKKQHNLKGRGEQAGIPHFNLDRLTSNTMASHRLIQMVGKRYGLAVSEAMYDALNVYYFVDGNSLNDRPKLASFVAQQLVQSVDTPEKRMDEDEVRRFLDSSEGRDEIEVTLDTLNKMGVHGIPKFIIAGYTDVDGAAQWDQFVEVFRLIEKYPDCVKPTVFGSLLGVSSTVMEEGSHTRESFLKSQS